MHEYKCIIYITVGTTIRAMLLYKCKPFLISEFQCAVVYVQWFNQGS